MNLCSIIAVAWTPDEQRKLFISLAILLALIVVLGAAVLIVRRKFMGEGDNTSSSADVGFSLSDLRAMRDRGEITAEEYETTRQRVISKVKSSVAQPPKKPPGI